MLAKIANGLREAGKVRHFGVSNFSPAQFALLASRTPLVTNQIEASLLPGKATLPHNHETWAIIVAVEGQELNRVYRREDDGRDPGRASLVLEREVVVQPGTPVAFLGEDLHGIRVEGDSPTLHFHLYGRPLESLDNRYGVKDDGSVVNYNKSQMAPSIAAYGL